MTAREQADRWDADLAPEACVGDDGTCPHYARPSHIRAIGAPPLCAIHEDEADPGRALKRLRGAIQAEGLGWIRYGR